MRVMVDAMGTVRGISIFTTVHAAWMGYLRYLAIHPDARSQGLGPALLSDVVSQVRRDGFRRMLLPYLGVVLEVERPDDALDEEERNIRARRIAWYRRNGGRLFEEVDLVTPPMGPGLPALSYHVMFIRAAPKRLDIRWMRRLMVRAVLVSGYDEPEDGAYARHAMGAPVSPLETTEPT